MLHCLRHQWPHKKDLCPQNFFHGGPKGRGARDARPQSKFFNFHAVFDKTFCKIRMHSSRMCTACSSSRHGVWAGDPPRPDPPQLPPWVWDWKACWACKACWDITPPPPRPATRQAGIPPPPPPETCCKASWDTTLSQTSFASGNNRLALPLEIWRPLVFLLTVLTSNLYVLISVH